MVCIFLLFIVVLVRDMHHTYVAWHSISKTIDYYGNITFVAEYQWTRLEHALIQPLIPSLVVTNAAFATAAIL